MKKYVVLSKQLGETPLACLERWRAKQPAGYRDTPLTYAGRLDPLASGKLLVLIGEECRAKARYLTLDKGYVFDILFGLTSDSGDVLGCVSPHHNTQVTASVLKKTLAATVGTLTLPYPAFSSKTVNGKPLHTWAAQRRLSEITIPNNTTAIYHLYLQKLDTLNKDQVYQTALKNIAGVAPVTDERKAVGNDFRRPVVLESWRCWYKTQPKNATYTRARVYCACSSGTYMRSLAEYIGTRCGSAALAFSITRTHLGRYRGRLGGRPLWWPYY